VSSEGIAELREAARRVRGKALELSHRAGAAHLASSLSCADILVAAYWRALRVDPGNPGDPERDRFILGKGHAAAALYATLCERGFFGPELLGEYGADGGRLSEHPGPGCAPGVEAAAGSLGHGLPWAVGLAMAGRIQGRAFRVMALLGDGDCEEGSTWEAALLAPARSLSNLTAVVDYNKWQATARSNDVMSLDPLARKWEAFGWDALEVDGHDLAALASVLARAPDPSGRPRAVVAHTIKGKGVSFMEDDNNWHYRVPDARELACALRELGLQ
jgi:transketolase